MSIFAIPADLVGLVRSGLYMDMHEQIVELGENILAPAREDRSRRKQYEGQYEELFARVTAAGAALRAVGRAPSGQPAKIELGEHRAALLRGLLERLRSAQDVLAAETGSKNEERELRAEAKANVPVLEDLIRRVEAVGVSSDDEPRDAGTEHAITQQLAFHNRPKGRTRRELGYILRDVDPDIVDEALLYLEAAGVVVLDGNRVLPSRCALRLDALGMIGL
jgi:hypothetical protein